MTPLVVEKLMAIVSDCHGSPAALRVPVHASTTSVALVEHGDRRAPTVFVGGHSAQRLGDAAEVGIYEPRDHARRPLDSPTHSDPRGEKVYRRLGDDNRLR